MCLQGARVLYERESSIDIDYSDLEDKLKKVLWSVSSITSLPLACLICSFICSPSPAGAWCSGSEGNGGGAQCHSDTTPDQPPENLCT